jgi:hypothetical protein
MKEKKETAAGKAAVPTDKGTRVESYDRVEDRSSANAFQAHILSSSLCPKSQRSLAFAAREDEGKGAEDHAH